VLKGFSTPYWQGAVIVRRKVKKNVKRCISMTWVWVRYLWSVSVLSVVDSCQCALREDFWRGPQKSTFLPSKTSQNSKVSERFKQLIYIYIYIRSILHRVTKVFFNQRTFVLLHIIACTVVAQHILLHVMCSCSHSQRSHILWEQSQVVSACMDIRLTGSLPGRGKSQMERSCTDYSYRLAKINDKIRWNQGNTEGKWQC